MTSSAIWGRGFRPFFLLAGIHAVLFVPAWLAVFNGWVTAPAWSVPVWWHAHEMVFGFVGAAIAGFLLTSVPVWTGTTAVAGPRLAGIAALWIAGRLAILFAGWLPALLVALVDLAFFVALIAAIAPALLAPNQRHNRRFLLILAGLFAANGLTHLQHIGIHDRGAVIGLRLGVDLVALLVVIVTGRITPSFTANALRRANATAQVTARPRIDRLAVGAVALLAGVDLVAPRTLMSGAVALLAALLVVVRMSGWQTLRTGSDPLLWSLHVGHAWVALGLCFVAAADLGVPIPATLGLHALTAGAFGATILAVMTRVGLGHTGRPLAAPRGVPLAYGLVSTGALLRVFGPLVLPSRAMEVLVASGLLWSAAFALFLLIYLPILTRPRVDGKPG